MGAPEGALGPRRTARGASCSDTLTLQTPHEPPSPPRVRWAGEAAVGPLGRVVEGPRRAPWRPVGPVKALGPVSPWAPVREGPVGAIRAR